ncbi:MAG TPA: hypothetical protein VEW42_01860 [Candidatus Eisenbacteria bacterium]|nr:hypothetical protein [Candidatus Eisenbacteria bacterium]
MQKYLSIKNVIASVVLIVIVVAVLLSATYAMPDFPLFLLKRWEEKVFSYIPRDTSDTISYNLFLLTRRLQEIDYITIHKEYSLFYPCSLRFATLAGETTALSIANNASKKQLLAVFAQDRREIDRFFARKDGKEDWKFIHDTSNYLTIDIGELKK